MKISIDTIDSLLRNSVKKANKTPDRIGLLETAEMINSTLPVQYKQIGSRYLYDTIFLSVQRARKQGESTINLDRSVLDSMAYYLGVADIDEYSNVHRPLVPEEAKAIEGNWYSIVRCNSGRPQVLVSPVKIEVIDYGVFLELRGPNRTYRGQVTFIGGSFSCFLISLDKVKVIHLAFRLGVAKQPKILSGLFSSISSSGLPVAGKELLLRTDKDYMEMGHQKIRLNENNSPENSSISAEILEYFSDFERCYIKIDTTSTFDLDDLQ